MPLTCTPRQFQRRAELYQQLGQMTAAGVTLVSALEMLERNPPSPSDRQPLARVLASIRDGATLSGALQGTGSWLTKLDIALLHAGERSGRLPECFRLLAKHYEERASLMRQVIADLAYPVGLFHFAVFLFPFPQLFLSGNWGAYLAQTVGILLLVYAVILLPLVLPRYALRGRHSEFWSETMERFVHLVPVLGPARHALALARLAAALEALLSAGVTIIEAWEIAAVACGSPILRHAVAAWTPQVRAGQTPAEAISRARVFPEMFANLYRTGELSGRLDESLRGLHQYYQEEGTRKLHLLAQWAPRLVYLLIMLAIAFKIVQFWLGYFQQINDAIKSVP